MQRGLDQSLSRKIKSRRLQLENREKLFYSYSPRRVLERGYAIVSKKGESISLLDQITVNDSLTLRLADGRASVKVKNKNYE